MINPQWLELPMSRTNFHGPKDFRAIEVRLYYIIIRFLRKSGTGIFGNNRGKQLNKKKKKYPEKVPVNEYSDSDPPKAIDRKQQA